MKIANVDETIRTNKGIIGVVEKVYENSVLIKILVNPTATAYENMRTVVNHKNYKIEKGLAVL